MKEMRTNF